MTSTTAKRKQIALAKKIMTEALQKRGVPFTKLTARTVSFEGFGYGKRIFVKIHGWQPNPIFDELEKVAIQCNFRITTDWGIS